MPSRATQNKAASSSSRVAQSKAMSPSRVTLSRATSSSLVAQTKATTISHVIQSTTTSPPRTAQSKRPTQQHTNPPKSPTQKISTDLSSYDRTDPFTAMDALRKLLSSLPNNPGKHRYRMNQVEHKAVMHLLTIVEPFVGPTVHDRKLTRLPTETLDNIASLVYSKSDLRSLAYTCRRMHDIVIHRHLDYHTIKTRIGSKRVWHHLSIHPGLARNTRHLEILDESSSDAETRIPSSITITDADVENIWDGSDLLVQWEKTIISAIAGMQGLESFVWSQSRARPFILLETLWPTLCSLPLLTVVDLNDNPIFKPVNDTEPEEEGGNNADEGTVVRPCLRPGNLQTHREILVQGDYRHLPQTNEELRYCKTPPAHSRLWRTHRMLRPKGTSMHLTLSSNLNPSQSLDISYIAPLRPGFKYPVADDLYSSGRWKDLTSLTLNNLWCTPEGLNHLTTFLSEHGNLEILNFNPTGASTAALVLPQNTLPHLKELNADRDFVNAVLSCDPKASRPLRTLKGIDLKGSESDRAFFENLARIGRKITRVDLAGWGEMKDLQNFLQHVPNLTWLDVRHDGLGHIPNRAIEAYGVVSTVSQSVRLRFWYTKTTIRRSG